MTTDTAPSPAHALTAGSRSTKELLAARRATAAAGVTTPDTVLTPAEVKARCATLAAGLDLGIALARERLAGAAGSPADTARWTALLQRAEEARSAAAAEGPTALTVLAAHADALLGVLLDTQPPWPGIPAVAAAIREGITGYTYFPGRRLQYQRIAARTGCGRADAKLALEDLAAEGIVTRSVTGIWYARDTRPAGHFTELAAGLLARAITAGAYPPGAVLSRTKLRDPLLADAGTVHDALHLPVLQGLVHRTQNRYVVRPNSNQNGSSWPLTDAGLLGRLPPPRETGAGHSLTVIRTTRQNARRRFRDGDVLPAAVMSVQEERQGGVLRRLVMSAHNQVRYQDHLDTRIQFSAAWALACTAMPPPAHPDHRLWQFAATSDAVAGLGTALSSSHRTHRSPW